MSLENRTDGAPDSALDLSEAKALYAAISGWIQTADTKAGLQLTASGLLVGILTDGLTSPQSILSTLTGAPLILVVCSYALLLVAVGLNLLALGPRLKKLETGSSPIYFGDISSITQDAYVKRTRTLSPAQLREEYLKQVHELSRISTRKHLRVQQGTGAILVAAALGILAWVAAGVGT